MADPDGILEIFLGPGDLFFGDRDTRIRTLLGSCVAVTLWHPRAKLGGMCHFVVPTRPASGWRAGTPTRPSSCSSARSAPPRRRRTSTR